VSPGSLQLDESNLPALARGCGMLASGGGGEPHLGLTMARLAVREYGPVPVISLADLDAGGLVMPCGLIGAPSVAGERVWSGDEGAALRSCAEATRGGEVVALMCFEIGGVNGLLPITWAARLGLPLVDADGMGRAFADPHRQAMRLAGVPASPVYLSDGRGNTLVLHAADDISAGRLARGAAFSLGGVCAGAIYCMTGEQARTAAIGGSISLALALGAAAGDAGAGPAIAAAVDVLGAVVLVEGRVADVERQSEATPVRGSATITGTGPDAGRELRLETQDEFLLAFEDGAVCAAVPDIICVLAGDGGEPVQAERLYFGLAVAVLAAPAPGVWGTAAGLALAGPRAHGYAVDHIPIARHGQRARV
jgi:DUF917 family protein